MLKKLIRYYSRSFGWALCSILLILYYGAFVSPYLLIWFFLGKLFIISKSPSWAIYEYTALVLAFLWFALGLLIPPYLCDLGLLKKEEKPYLYALASVYALAPYVGLILWLIIIKGVC